MARHEQQPGYSGEKINLNQETISEQNERLRKDREKANEKQPKSPESTTDARNEALEQANESEKKHELQTRERSPAERRPLGKEHRDKSFQKTMSVVQSELSSSSRAFSKVIHNKAIERTSEVVGSTIARPNAILAGSMSAFICTLGVYLIAKRYGYELSGFETIAAFIGGWLIGVLYDFFRAMITGKR